MHRICLGDQHAAGPEERLASGDWETRAEYLDHLDALPLGTNVTPMFGHSAVRVAVMGLG